MNVSIGIENCKISLFRDFNIVAPIVPFCLAFVFLIWGVPVDEISYIFVEKGTHPSVRGRVELKYLFLFVLESSYLYFFAGDRTVDLIGGRLLDGFGGENLFGGRNDGKGIAEVVLGMVSVGL